MKVSKIPGPGRRHRRGRRWRSLATAAPSRRRRSSSSRCCVYRTGAYAPNGVPFANGYVDYLKLVNAATAASTA